MKLYICVCFIVSMDVLSTAIPIAGNGAETAIVTDSEVEPHLNNNMMPGIATQNRKDDNHADHHMFNLRELLQLKAILDRQLVSAIATEPPQENDFDDEFDPVFGKLRDFLDKLTVEDLERANAKLKSWQARHENVEELPVTPPVNSNSVNVNHAISVKKAEYGPCRIEFDKAFASGDSNLPYCDENGFFVTKQCSGSICLCVDKNGKPTMGQTPLWRADELVCDKQESVDDAIEELRGLLDANGAEASMATVAEDETQPNDDFYVQGIATQNRKDDYHADNHMFNLRELLLLKAILDRQLISAITTEPPQETEDDFDPVFGKLRDFLDELTVEDLERANAKLKSWQANHENTIGLPVYSNPANVDEAISVKKAERGPCSTEFDKAFASGDSNLPYCDENGFFVTKQCSGSICFCVDKNGKPTMGQTPLWRADELVCDKQESVDDAIEELRGLLDGNRHHNNQAQQNPR